MQHAYSAAMTTARKKSSAFFLFVDPKVVMVVMWVWEEERRGRGEGVTGKE